MGELIHMKAGKINIKDIKKKINKSMGMEAAFDLRESNPTEVVDWIPTGSRWLDSSICKGKMAGIPVGKITELAGQSSVGKSYMAVQIAANAQKRDIFVVYYDSESAIDPMFLEDSGIDLDNNWMYTQAITVEKVLSSIETLMTEYPDNRFLFIWDSIAATACEKDIEGNFNPQATMAVKPRILGKGFRKLTIPLANQQCTLLLVNQLKTNITTNVSEAMTTPWFAPGGKAIEYMSSLRIWLTSRKSKASFVFDENGRRIGSEVKAKLKKSRFGTQDRMCGFQILWGDAIGIMDEESWLEVIKQTSSYRVGGGWCYLKDDNGTEHKFRQKEWKEKLQDEKFKELVLKIMDYELIEQFASGANNITLEDEEEKE